MARITPRTTAGGAAPTRRALATLVESVALPPAAAASIEVATTSAAAAITAAPSSHERALPTRSARTSVAPTRALTITRWRSPTGAAPWTTSVASSATSSRPKRGRGMSCAGAAACTGNWTVALIHPRSSFQEPRGASPVRDDASHAPLMAARRRARRCRRLRRDRRDADPGARPRDAPAHPRRRPLEALAGDRRPAGRRGRRARPRGGGHRAGLRRRDLRGGEPRLQAPRPPAPSRSGRPQRADGADGENADHDVVSLRPRGVRVRVRHRRRPRPAPPRAGGPRARRPGRLLARAHRRALPGRRAGRVAARDGRRADDRPRAQTVTCGEKARGARLRSSSDSGDEPRRPASDARAMGDRGRSRLPEWLHGAGSAAWLVVGIMLVVAGAVWLLAQTSTIVMPVIAGAVIAAVGAPAVTWFERHRTPRALGSAAVMLGLVVVGLVVAGLVLGGISSQSSQISSAMSTAVDKVADGLDSLGISSSADVAASVKKAVPEIGGTLLKGVAHGISGLASLLVFLGFTTFIAFFALKDGPALGEWVERRAGLRADIARIVVGDVLHALRKYFLGLTIISAFNAVIVGAGALLLGVPLAGTIAVVTFVGGFIPIIGAWTAGIFAFALALADSGTSTAFAMALVVFLANGPLQQIVQPITYGATLNLNPLVVFVSTIAAGCLFGTVGLVLAAPLVSAGVHIHAHLAERDAAVAAEPDSVVPAAAVPGD